MADWSITNFGNIITVVSFVLGVIGLYVGFKGWKRKRPTYVIRSNNIFSGLEHTIPEVEVRFPDYGLPVKALTVTKIAFWNAGTDTINEQDVVRDNPLSLRAKPGVVILSVSILERTNTYNQIKCVLNRERTQATISFDYLDHNEGALIQIFHSGTGSDDIQHEGTIKGARSVQRRSLDTPAARKQQPSRWLAIPAVCLIWALFAMLGYMMINGIELPPIIGGDPLLGYILIVLLTGLGLILGVSVVHHLYVTTVPKPLSNIHLDNPD